MIQISDISNSYFTADNHFYHDNIIRFCNRPFTTVEEMNRVMIDNWNKVIGKNTIVYHLGDLTLHNEDYAREIISQLNGRIVFITPTWHHDKRWYGTSCISKSQHYVSYLEPLQLMKLPNGLKITCCHYPFEEWESSFHGALHFHGHTHGRLPEIPNRIDVGVDNWGFTPVSLNTLLHGVTNAVL